jgi:hypothetical protein
MEMIKVMIIIEMIMGMMIIMEMMLLMMITVLSLSSYHIYLFNE